MLYKTWKWRDINYKERLRSIREIGLVIAGESEMHNPKVMLGVD